MPAQVKGQVGMDEQVLDDPALEKLLETRAKLGDQRSALTAKYSEADDKAKAALAELDIPDEGAIRVGRFRITKRTTPARHVEFDAEATTGVRIALSEHDA